MTIKINADHLGNEATKEQAERMVELLKDRGYDVEYGQPVFREERADNVFDEDWEECLDIISK